VGIQSGAPIGNLPPGYYNRVIDYSPQIGELSTKLASLGNPGAPGDIQANINTVKQQIQPFETAQSLLAKIQGLGNPADPASIQAQINALQQQAAPFETAQGLLTKIQGLGPTGDVNTLQTELSSLNQKAASLNDIAKARQNLLALGPVPTIDDIANQQQIMANSLQWHGEAEGEPPGFGAEKIKLSDMIRDYEQAEQARVAIDALLANAGITADQLDPTLGALNAQMDATKLQYDAAINAAGLRSQLANLSGNGDPNVIATSLANFQSQLTPLQQSLGNATEAAGLKGQLASLAGTTDPNEIASRLGAYQSQLTPLQQLLANATEAQDLQSQIESLRNATPPTTIIPASASQPFAPPVTIAPARIQAVADIDRGVASNLADLDRAVSSNNWTSANANALVDLANSIRGKSALKDVVTPELAQLVSQLKAQRVLPPSLSDQALPEAVAAAAKFRS